jgi:hypothetical protein
MKIAGYAAAQVFRLAHINNIALGVLVQIHSGFGGDTPDFLEKVHQAIFVFYLMSGCANVCYKK